MAEATRIQEEIDALREKIQSNHDASPDKSFLKGSLGVYEKCLPEIDIDGLKEQLDMDEAICKLTTERVAASVQKVKDEYLKFAKQF